MPPTNSTGQRNSSGLTPEDYDFRFVGSDVTSGRRNSSIRSASKPRCRGKFLYKGKVRVDTTDAVSRVVPKPRKNPSFWISHTEIEQEYKKRGEFGYQSGTSASPRSGLGAQQN